MDSYTSFAALYDLFMEDIPYDEWADWILSVLHAHGIRDGIAADLGCGTGQITRRLARAGYDMIGIDASPQMLEAASEKELPENGGPSDPPILYLNQDIRSFELYGTVRAVVCVCDTLNYMLTPADLLSVFRLVNNYLDPGGLFLFDMHTEAFYRSIGDSVIAEDRGCASFIWENEYDPVICENTYRMIFYAEEEDGLYRRMEEEHVTKAYPAELITALLAEAGLKLLAVRDADNGSAPSETSERLQFAAAESGK